MGRWVGPAWPMCWCRRMAPRCRPPGSVPCWPPSPSAATCFPRPRWSAPMAGTLTVSPRAPTTRSTRNTSARPHRAARIAECAARIAELDEALAGLHRRLEGLAATLSEFAQARAALPRTAEITAAGRAHSQAVGELRAARAAADSAQYGYDESVAACTVTERALRRTAIDHALEPEHADQVEAATRRFEASATGLTGRRRELAQRRDAAASADGRLEQATDEERACARTESAARRRHTEEAAKLAALRGAVGKEAQQVMAQIDEAERGTAAAEAAERAARTAEMEAVKAVSAATERVAAGRRALGVAVAE